MVRYKMKQKDLVIIVWNNPTFQQKTLHASTRTGWCESETHFQRCTHTSGRYKLRKISSTVLVFDRTDM